MRVLLTIVSGPKSGQKVLLGPNRILEVGRSDWADICCDYDEKMSRVHFRLETTQAGVQVADLKSTNGTLVNGEPLSEAPRSLGHGDEISAGYTQFKVEIEGNVPGGAHDSSETRFEARREPTATRPQLGRVPAAALAGSYTVESCDSGLSLFRGGFFGEPGEPAQASQLARAVAQHFPLTLIVHFFKLGLPVPHEVPGMVPLFDWMPAEIARQSSPQIIPGASLPQLEQLIDTGWGQDGMLCFYSKETPELLAAHLQRAVHFNSQGVCPAGSAQNSMLGYCWPNVLAQLLAFRSQKFVTNLMSGIEAVFMEVPDLPGSWQLYGNVALQSVLERCGLRAKNQTQV